MFICHYVELPYKQQLQSHVLPSHLAACLCLLCVQIHSPPPC